MFEQLSLFSLLEEPEEKTEVVEDLKKPLYERITDEQELRIAEKIQQRRLQILVHSYLYYELDTNLVDDNTWANWAKELVALQNANPDLAKRVIYHEAFSSFDPSTGQGLPYNDEQIVKIATRLKK